MFMLTTTQLNVLRADLQGLAGIEYDDVLNELLDHYATLTEQRVATGLAFDDASKWAWAELGSGEGLQAVQDDYVKNIQQQVRLQHLTILKSYFRWPTFVVTALVAALVHVTVPLLPEDAVVVSFWVLAVMPIGINMWGHRKSAERLSGSGPIVFEYMKRNSGLFLNLTQLGLSPVGGTFLGHHEKGSILKLYASASTIIVLLMIL